jgi:hypothetical protein
MASKVEQLLDSTSKLETVGKEDVLADLNNAGMCLKGLRKM